MRLVMTGIILLGLLFSAQAQDEHKRAAALYKSGNYKDALTLLDESIQSNPTFWYPIMLKGQCNQKLKKYEEALRNYNDVLTMEIPSENIPAVKNYIAQCYTDMKDYKKAIQAYTDLLAQAPDSRKFTVLFARGQAELQAAKADEEKNNGSSAKSFYSKAVNTFSDALKAPTSDKGQQAEASFQKAFAQYKIGNLTGGIKSLEESIKSFQDVISKNPREERAYKMIVNLQYEIVEKSSNDSKPAAYADMATYADRYLKQWPNDEDMQKKKAQALQGAKKYKEAIAAFEALAKAHPRDGFYPFSVGACLMADKQFGKAIESLEKARANGRANDPLVYSYTSNCYAKQKTGCYSVDLDMERKGVDILDRGVKATSGQAKAALQKELDAKRNNLKILEGNLATDNGNHAATIDNIKKLNVTIASNSSKLQKNKELYLGTPTAELKKAIDATQSALDSDKASLAKEFKTLEGYVNDGKKCAGDSSLLVNYKAMVELLKSKK